MRHAIQSDGVGLLDKLPHKGGSAIPLVVSYPVEAYMKPTVSYGSHQLRQYLGSIGSDLLPRSTSPSKVSTIVLRSDEKITWAKMESFSQWFLKADAYTAELIRFEGRGDSTDGRCSRCLDTLCDGLGIHCQDCYDEGLYCVTCCVYIHSCHPFHRIQVCTVEQNLLVRSCLLLVLL